LHLLFFASFPGALCFGSVIRRLEAASRSERSLKPLGLGPCCDTGDQRLGTPMNFGLTPSRLPWRARCG
jgi:hypothetical protein